MVFAIKERHEGVRAQSEFSRGVIRHGIIHSGMIANRRGDVGVPVDDRAESKEVGDDRIDGGSLLKCPRDCGGVVATCHRGVPGPIWTY